MASHALALYTASSSPYNLDEALSFTREDLEWEEALSVSMTPLAILPPPMSYDTSSGGDSLKSMARTRPPLTSAKIKPAPPRRPTMGTIGIKRAAPGIGGPSKRPVVLTLGNTSSRATSSLHTAKPSLSHTLVGIDLPNGGRGKGLMRKPTKALAPKPVSTGKGPAKTSSGEPFRIPRKNSKKAPGVFESGSESGPSLPKAPTLSSLSKKVDVLYGLVGMLEGEIEKNESKNAKLVEDPNNLRLSFSIKLTRVAKAAGVAHALNPSK